MRKYEWLRVIGVVLILFWWAAMFAYSRWHSQAPAAAPKPHDQAAIQITEDGIELNRLTVRPGSTLIIRYDGHRLAVGSEENEPPPLDVPDKKQEDAMPELLPVPQQVLPGPAQETPAGDAPPEIHRLPVIQTEPTRDRSV